MKSNASEARPRTQHPPAPPNSVSRRASQRARRAPWRATLAAWFATGAVLAAATPPPTADLSLWLQADDGVVLNGDGVARWTDRSGQGHDASQEASLNQPKAVATSLGKPAVRFDGVNDFLAFTNAINELSGLSIFLVANNTSPAQDGGSSYSDSPAIFWNETDSWGWVFLSPFQGNVNWRIGTTIANNNQRYDRPSSVASAYTLTELVKNSDVESLYVNGEPVHTVSGLGLYTYGVREDGYLGRGDSTYFAGDVLEVLVYNAALSDADRATVEAYLTDKYLANPAPTVSIASPAEGATFSAPANVTIAADATDNTGVAQVEFLVDGQSVGVATTAPYSVAWNNVAGGAHNVTVRATDTQGAWSTATRVVRVKFATPQEGPTLEGLGLWYKADAGVVADSGSVSRWEDQSGYAHHAVQPVAEARPTAVTAGNGRPAVAFDGIDQCMTFAMPMNDLSELTMVAVVNNTAPQNTGAAGEGCAVMYWTEPPSPGWGGLSLGVFQDSATWRIGTTVPKQAVPTTPARPIPGRRPWRAGSRARWW